MQKNPENYYIWRTKGDDKVRSKHAEREGKIFNKHIPPEGGNPGEDYNCRCWAEPYKPEKVERLGITAKVDLFGLPQYAENDKAEVKSDSYLSPKHKNNQYLIGSLSQEFESNGNPAAIGFDNSGGYSYGLYQIATYHL